MYPKSTADSPMREPTLRSIPPETITGVRASANRPISTLRRTTSSALSFDMKLVPMTQKTAISTDRTSTSTSSWVRCNRGRPVCSRGGDSGADMAPPPNSERVRRHREKDDAALDGLGPLGTRAEKNQGGPDGAKQGHA